MTKFLAVCFSAVLLMSFAPSDYTLLLKSGNTELTEGKISSSLKGETINKKYVRIMQFYALPGEVNKALMIEKGIEFHEYIPKNAYLVSIPKSISTRELGQFNIRSIAKISPAMKLSAALTNNSIPYWAELENDKIGLVVKFFPGVSDVEISSTLNELQAEAEFQNHIGYRRIEIYRNQIATLAANPFVQFIQADEAPAEPENFRARTNHRVNAIQGNYAGALNYNGADVTVAIGDDGDIGPHIDYTGRLTSYAGASGGDHGDHVAGTVFGAGNRDPRGRGMAPEAEVVYFDYSNGNGIYLQYADTIHTQLGAVITQSSYSNGLNAGYTALCQQLDQQVYQNKSLIHIFSSGNSGTSNGGWYNITGGHKVGKNVIATGNLQWNDALAGSSSRGPAHDGRIKPDVCAVGSSVYSTIDGNNYGLKSGTSMASPGVSGVMATLYQAYKSNHGGAAPYSGLMKAVLMNTAEDIGNPGPDFKHGYGRINALRAAQTIEANHFMIDSISQGLTDTLSITVPANLANLKVMVYWTDPESNINTNRALVNDLDFTLISGSNSWQPWVLNSTSTATLDNDAVRGKDSLNNAEQVTVATPTAGTYKIVVNGTSVPMGPQKYFVVYSYITDDIVVTHPIGGEHFDPAVSEIIRWDAPEETGNFMVEYSTDGGATYSTIANAVPANQMYYSWNVPAALTGQARVRVSRNGKSDESDADFSIIRVPNNLAIDWACPDSLKLVWDSTPGATSYEVSTLGQKYMDSIGTTTTNSLVVYGVNPSKTYWYSVRALGPNNASGRRAEAIEKQPGVINCLITKDVYVSHIISPNEMPACQNTDTLEVTLTIKNTGVQTVTNIPLAYKLGTNTTVRDTLKSTLDADSSATFTFAMPITSISGAGNYALAVFSELAGDQNKYNDTINHEIEIYPSNLITVPHAEDFETFSQCGTSNNCGDTHCSLLNGWRNAPNGESDDIDFRTNSGATPSNQTGPSSDHTTGNSNGKYLYLEASNNCYFHEAQLISPCLDLMNTSLPQASIWYHMYGSNMGELHVDVYADGEWTNDVVTAISGQQGNSWKNLLIDLSAFNGKIINLRFRGITGSNFASDLALDDFSILDLNSVALANFSMSKQVVCQGSTVTFTDQSLGTITGYNWDFGPGASPATATTAGPHNVTYTTLGAVTPTLTVTNSFGNNVSTSNLTVTVAPVAAYSTVNSAPLTIDFTDLSTNQPTAWVWNFGDGSISQNQNPTHTYASEGTYVVTLNAANVCGGNTVSQTVYATFSLNEQTLQNGVYLVPNPASQNVALHALFETDKTLNVELFDYRWKNAVPNNMAKCKQYQRFTIAHCEFSRWCLFCSDVE